MCSFEPAPVLVGVGVMASVALERSLFELGERIRSRSARIEATGWPLRPLRDDPRGKGAARFEGLAPGAAGEALRPSGPAPVVPVLPGSPAEATKRLVGEAAGELADSSARIYRALHEVALVVARARGYVAGVSQVSFHVPAEVVAYALHMHRATLYRQLPKLKALGLVDWRAHRTTYNARVVADGTVWSVKLRPTRGKSARVSIEDLQHKWRDLGWDVLRGRTAYHHVRQSNTEDSSTRGISALLLWALPQEEPETPLSMTVAPGRTPARAVGLEGVLDVPYATRPARAAAVDTAARSVCALLGDDSVNFYRWLLWQLLRLHDRGQDHFGGVFVMLERALADHREGFARTAGALFVSRLKRWQVWELVKATPPWAAGDRPRTTAR